MADIDLADQIAKENLYTIGYRYLCNNFHKLSTSNKIRVAISVLQIFNKDGSKTDDGRKLVYVVNGDRRQENTIEILPSQFPVSNPELPEPV